MSSPSREQQIRYILGAVGDNVGILAEQEIEDALLLYPSDWRLAAAYIADSLSSRAISDPSSFSLAGVMSVGWTSQASMWSKLAISLRKDVAADEARDSAGPGSIQSRYLKRQAQGVVEEFTQPRKPWRS